MTDKKWQMLIRKARGYLLKEKGHQFKIAEIAMEACVMEHGGDRGRKFTVKKFAEAIGINDKTLHQWIRLKRRVIDKLPVKTKVDSIPFEVLYRVDNRISDDQSPKQVTTILNEEWSRSPLFFKWAKYTKVLKTILHNANTPIKLMEVDDHTIEEVIKLCNTISNLMALELDFRKKGTSGAKEKALAQTSRFGLAVARGKSEV